MFELSININLQHLFGLILILLIQNSLRIV